MKYLFWKGCTGMCAMLFLSIFISTTSTYAQNRKPRERDCSDNCGNKTIETKTTMTNNKVIACKLTSKELQQRKATVIAALKKEMLERKDLDNGYLYKFKGDDAHLDRLAEFIKTERACCGFFTFRVTVEDEYALLELTGPDGAKDFINSEIGL